MTNTATRTITARLPDDLVTRLDSAARADERSRSNFIRRAVERALADPNTPRDEYRETRSD